MHPVLDVGCGDGFFVSCLTEDNTIDVGIDIYGSRLEEARGLKAYKKLIYYDGKKFPFSSTSFSTVFSNCVLEHIPDIQSVLQEMYRVLKPNGRIYITVMAKPWEDNLFGSMILGHTYTAYMRQKQQHMHVFLWRQWQTSFERAGFTIEKSIGYLSPKACRFIDIAHYLSIPNLLSYIFLKTWVLFPSLTVLYPRAWLSRLIERDEDKRKAGALFFVLKKE